MFVIANREDVSSSNLNISVPVLLPDNYTVIVYDLGSDRLPVLSDENNSYVIAAEKENVIITDQAEARGTGYPSGSFFARCLRLR